MFTFSFHHLNQLSREPLDLTELLELLNLQGLEVKKVVPWQGDTAITIEVKANRSFCLSYWGLLREVAAFKKWPEPHLLLTSAAPLTENTDFPLPIAVETKQGCPTFCAAILNHINNHAKTPPAIANALLAVGMHTIHPVVDVLNFLMLET